MAVTTAVLSGNVTDITGALTSAYLKRVVVVVEANTDGSLLLDTDGNRIMAGPKRVTVDTSTGAYTVTLPKTDSADILPASPGRLYRVRLIYPSGIPGAGNISQTSGWWELTADGSLSDADKWPGLEVTSVSDELLDTIAQNADDAEAAAAAAEAAQAAVEAVVATTDGLMTAVDDDDASDFRVQQDARHAATYVGKGVQIIDVRDIGVVGDFASHPLSGYYGTLGAAQAVYPSATSLTNERDWAALQSAMDDPANAGAVFYFGAGVRAITNRGLIPQNSQRFIGAASVFSGVWNTATRNSPALYQVQAAPFLLGNMHPIIKNTSQPTYQWAAYELNAVSVGAQSVTISTPGSVTQTVAAGDVVLVRDESPTADGVTGVCHAYEQWNRIVSYNTGTGVAVLERPVTVSIVSGVAPTVGAGGAPSAPTITLSTTNGTGGAFYAAGSYTWRLTAFNGSGESARSNDITTTLTTTSTQVITWSAVGTATGYYLYRVNPDGSQVKVATLGAVTTVTDVGTSTILSCPKIMFNAGTNVVDGFDWFAAQDVHFENLTLSGTAPFGTKALAYGCTFKNLIIDAQDFLSCNAFVECYGENISGTFTGRMIEIAQASRNTTFKKLTASYKYDATNPSPNPTMNFGEQSYAIRIEDIDCTLGTDFPASVRAAQIGGVQNFTMTGTIRHYGAGSNVDLMSIASSSNNARPPKGIRLQLALESGHVLTNYLTIGTSGTNLANPDDVAYDLRVNTPAGAASYAVVVNAGTSLCELALSGDTLRTNVLGGETPRGASIVLATLASVAATGTASTDNINATAHGLGNGQAIQFTTLTGGVGLSTGTTYYVVNRATNSFQVSTTLGGSVVDITTNYSAVAYGLAFPSGVSVYGNDFTMTGPKSSDQAIAAMQQLLVPTAGAWKDLRIEADITAASTVTLSVRNRSATTVVFAAGTPFWVYTSWRKLRP